MRSSLMAKSFAVRTEAVAMERAVIKSATPTNGGAGRREPSV